MPRLVRGNLRVEAVGLARTALEPQVVIPHGGHFVLGALLLGLSCAHGYLLLVLGVLGRASERIVLPGHDRGLQNAGASVLAHYLVVVEGLQAEVEEARGIGAAGLVGRPAPGAVRVVAGHDIAEHLRTHEVVASRIEGALVGGAAVKRHLQVAVGLSHRHIAVGVESLLPLLRLLVLNHDAHFHVLQAHLVYPHGVLIRIRFVQVHVHPVEHAVDELRIHRAVQLDVLVQVEGGLAVHHDERGQLAGSRVIGRRVVRRQRQGGDARQRRRPLAHRRRRLKSLGRRGRRGGSRLRKDVAGAFLAAPIAAALARAAFLRVLFHFLVTGQLVIAVGHALVNHR